MSERQSLPKYQQIAHDLEEALLTGQWKGGKVPSVRELAVSFGVSIMTASRALQVLRDKRLVNTVERSGSTVVMSRDRTFFQLYAVQLHVTPGPFSEASANVNAIGFEELAKQDQYRFRLDWLPRMAEVTRESLAAALPVAKEEGLAGVFLLPGRVDDAAARRDELFLRGCQQRDIPVVLVERNLRGEKRELAADLVAADDLNGGRALTRHLIDQGRERIAFVMGSPVSSHEARRTGYVAEMVEAGLKPQFLTQSTDVPHARAYKQLAAEVVAAKVDGVVCYIDYSALGVGIELLRRGVRIPDQVALCGFDNVAMGDLFSIGITTYEFPSLNVAREAVRMMERRQAEPDAPVVQVTVPGRILVRNSSSS